MRGNSNEMTDNYVYMLDGKAYVNLTNRCHNACTFCIRNTGDCVAGTPLWLKKEPTADEVMRAFDKIRPKLESDEVVFCGYGEPTERLDVLTETAARIKAAGYGVRLNTNGLGSLVAGRDIAPELKDFDLVSISLNHCDADKYAAVTRSKFGAAAFPAVTEFAAQCKAAGLNVVMTVVDVIGEESIRECEKLCQGLGVPLRVRKYVADNYDGSVDTDGK